MHPTTFLVPAHHYDEALAFCNDRLAEQGKPPIIALPAGHPTDPTSCPCSVACGVEVGAITWRYGTDHLCSIIHDPAAHSKGHPTNFVRYFDTHAPRTLCLPIRGPFIP